MKNILLIILLPLLLLTACSAMAGNAPATKTPIPLPTANPTMIVPTPSSLRAQITWRDLQVVMQETEITAEFNNEFGSIRVPPADRKFLWVHVRVKNTGQSGSNLPLPENFSVLYAASEFKPIYGYRQGHVEYADLDAQIFPNQEVDGWLRFDIPVIAGLKDLLFVFLPESNQIGASFSSPYYPYADDKPTFVWKCGQ